jgi:ssDNA-binding replication factor A large subunit
MYDLEGLIREVLKGRPELTKEELLARIEEKKRTVGAGYLTDQGAAFLIAGEFGVALQQASFTDLSLKDLYVGANDVTVKARLLALYPKSTYKKKDGGESSYRRAVLFDKEKTVKLTMWEDKAGEPERAHVSAGSPVRVVSAYVKQGLDGKPELNLGRRGKVEELKEAKDVAALPSLDQVAAKLRKLDGEGQIPVLECEVTTPPRYSEFERSDGSKGSLFQFEVAGEQEKDRYRVVIWSPTERPELSPGEKVRVTNLRVRKSSRGELEIHGDAGSVIGRLAGDGTRIEMRVASLVRHGNGLMVGGIGRDKKVKFVETAFEPAGVRVGDVVAVSADGRGSTLTCKKPESFAKIEGDRFPALEMLSTKLKDARDESSQVMLEAIALSHGTAEDVQLKDGSMVKKGELMLGDDTGEARMVAWRELAARVAGYQPGERLRVVGVTPKVNKMGSWNLQMSAMTAIERLKSD